MAIVSKSVPVPPLVPVKRALLSVFDKSGLIDFAKALADRGVELVSTGGSYKALKEAGLAVLDISEVTGFPEIMDGRVKTLHPAVHGGLLSILWGGSKSGEESRVEEDPPAGACSLSRAVCAGSAWSRAD